MKRIKLPQGIMEMAGLAGMKADQIDVIDLWDIKACERVIGLVRGRSIGVVGNRYYCAEKWSLPILEESSIAASFISFGLGIREKLQPKSINDEIRDYCARQKGMGIKNLAVYYCSNGGRERHIIIVGIRDMANRQKTRTSHRDFL